ncbi:MAG: FAD-dependent oxidoreductase, partial [Pseudoclavibacter sp.]|nr:FAD-dependent oxidoreductase [Pseudoclavibacter sp.]
EPNAYLHLNGAHDETMLPATAVEAAEGVDAEFLRGIGRLDLSGRDEAEYDKRHEHAEVVVVGAGPAGLAAALAAAAGGARVVLVEQDPLLGGDLLAASPDLRIEGASAAEWLETARAALDRAPECRVLTRTTLLGSYDGNTLVALERRDAHPHAGRPGVSRQRLWHLTARRVVLATGALERPIAFPGNDLPGVMLASAARVYARRYAIRPAGSAVVATTNDAGYETALALAATGARVSIVDAREQGAEAELREACEAAGVRIEAGAAVVEALGARRVEGVRIARLDEAGRAAEPVRSEACELLAVSGGWTPAVHLHSQRQGRVAWDEAAAAFLPVEPVPGQLLAGSLCGAGTTAQALSTGRRAGLEAAEQSGFPAPRTEAAAAPETLFDHGPGRTRPLWLVLPPDGEGLDRAFVDLHRDATAADVLRATGAGLRSVEHVKRYTSIGTGAEQGRTGGVTAVAIVAAALGGAADGTGAADPGAVGTTGYRAPYTPVAFAALAGRSRGELYDPVRRTPSHEWASARGALFEDVGQWKRAWYFPQPGESMDEAVARECRAARRGVAFMDATTLGKIEIRGRDAGVFLNRIYTNAFAKLPEGKARYGVMCTPDGMVFDDGVTLRLAEDRYFMTTTTGGAARVLEWLEEWLQTEWPELDVVCTSATEQFATIAVVGPRSRDVLAKLLPGEDVGREAWGFMEFRQTVLASGVPARVCRISFSGELAFEINVDTWYGASVWEQVAEAGAEFGITPYGTETMHVLRAEKAFPIVGQDTDGTVAPQDLGMEWVVSKTKDFVGRRSFDRPSHRTPRKELVALLPLDRGLRLPEGAQIVEAGVDPATAAPPVPMLGHVTSSYRSEALGRTFALALVLDGRARIGGRLRASFQGTSAEVEVVDPVVYDPDGARRDGDEAPEPQPTRRREIPPEPTGLRRSPAAQAAERMAAGSVARVRLRELPFHTMIGLRVQPGSAAAERCGRALGTQLPERCGALGGDPAGDGAAVLWIGPDELLVVAPEQAPAERAALLSALVEAVGEDPGQAVDLSANRTILELTGPEAREVLAKSCPIDLHDRAFPPGTAVSALLGAFPVLLWRSGEQTWRILPRASFAQSAADWLLDGMREFGHA